MGPWAHALVFMFPVPHTDRGLSWPAATQVPSSQRGGLKDLEAQHPHPTLWLDPGIRLLWPEPGGGPSCRCPFCSVRMLLPAGLFPAAQQEGRQCP